MTPVEPLEPELDEFVNSFQDKTLEPRKDSGCPECPQNVYPDSRGVGTKVLLTKITDIL